MSVWTQLGVGGIFVILVLRMVFEFVRERKNANGGGPAWAKVLIHQIDTALNVQTLMSREIRDLHDWHAPEGGEQTWKNTHMLRLVEQNNVLLAESHALLKEHHLLMKRLMPVLEKLV